MTECTYVLGFWKVPGNKKHGMPHYFKHMPTTFDMLTNKKIVFFYEDDTILNYVKSIVKTPHFIPIHIQITDLPTYALSADLLASCKRQKNRLIPHHKYEKGLAHYNREYLLSGEENYRKIISIWTSKIFLIQKVMDENPYTSDTFAWVDVSASRFATNYIIKGLDDTKMNTSQNELMLYMGEKMYNSATCMIAKKCIWEALIPLYVKKLHDIKDSNYAHDEETILFLINKEHPDLFTVLK